MAELSAASRLRNMEVFRASVSSMNHVALVPEVQEALTKWVKEKVGAKAPGVLIGGLAMSFYSTPRATQDVDLLFLTSSDIPDSVEGFRRHRRGAYEDTTTNVEIELVLPGAILLPFEVADKVYRTAVLHQGLRVASREGLIALKLYGALNPRRRSLDIGDVSRLLSGHLSVDMSAWALTKEQRGWLQNEIDLLK